MRSSGYVLSGWVFGYNLGDTGCRWQVFSDLPFFSVFFVPYVVKGLFAASKKIKDLTQRTQRHSEPQRVLKRKEKMLHVNYS